MYCPKCGSLNQDGQNFCSGCGAALTSPPASDAQNTSLPMTQNAPPVGPVQTANPQAPSIIVNVSNNQDNANSGLGGYGSYNVPLPPQKSKETAGIICLFLGWLGVHDFYVGKVTPGIIKLILSITCIGSFISVIWAFIDAINIVGGSYVDNWNRPLLGDAPFTKFLLFLPILAFVLLIVLCVAVAGG